MKINYLSASLPLTKTIEKLPDGTLFKTPYPLVANFTSEEIEVNTLGDLYKSLTLRATRKDKPCLLKGTIARPLTKESRAGSTNTNSATAWGCFDLDSAPFSHPDEFMRAVGLGDISYIVQYSSSHNLDPKDKTLSCHLFFLFEQPIAAPQLKAWLMHLNLSIPALAAGISLSKSLAALHWPLDITGCQNDKLLYTAEPIFKGMKSPMDLATRIQLVTRKKGKLPSTLVELRPVEALKKKAKAKLNELRAAPGLELPALSLKTKMVGEFEVQSGVGEVTNYQVIPCGEFVRLNLNNGDSQAYWHPLNDFELLRNFKGEAFAYMKDILPTYYAECSRAAKTTITSPTQGGEILLAFRDKVSAKYWKGTWHPDNHALEVYRVDNPLMLDHFLQAHGRQLGAFVPEWQMTFNPRSDVVVDEDNHVLNTFVQPPLMRKGKKCAKANFPVVQRILDSAIGTGAIQEHFLNWLACIWQHRRKTLTAWVIHGHMEGTGKGSLIHKVIRPLFNDRNVIAKRASELKEKFNGHFEQALIAFIDEIDVDMFENQSAMESEIRSLITEPSLSVRKMNTNSYEMPNFTNFIFSSNKSQPVHIPPNDRRFNVGSRGVSRISFEDHELTEDEARTVRPAELEAFAHYLASRKADLKMARTVLLTEERTQMQKLAVTSVDELATDLTDGNLLKLWDSLPDAKLRDDMNMVDITAIAFTQMMYRFAKETESRISRDELGIIFEHCVGVKPNGTHKLTAFLRHHGIVLDRQRCDGIRAPCLVTRWKISAEERRELLELVPGTKPKMIRSVK